MKIVKYTCKFIFARVIHNLTKEHLVNSHPALIVYLMILFNIMSIHNVVPDGFGAGIVITIVEDKLGDITDAKKYRGITLCPCSYISTV